ncbi:hypothetical protein HMPREF0889_0844 [Megasphaera lornae]|uniref:Uncharacterized protein n=1 Tax=Megasphaera lornae TaxID=1000568 RepID=D3LX34_9FIRM|nr:hypothetical protein HMPREF0889_0844 [Megasphaera genomosp. type_1 str. 28L]
MIKKNLTVGIMAKKHRILVINYKKMKFLSRFFNKNRYTYKCKQCILKIVRTHNFFT